jgi:hypothetical protein
MKHNHVGFYSNSFHKVYEGKRKRFITLGDFMYPPRHLYHGRQHQFGKSKAHIDSWEKNFFKGGEYGAGAPKPF